MTHGGERRRKERWAARKWAEILPTLDLTSVGAWSGVRWMEHVRFGPRTTQCRREQSAYVKTGRRAKRRVW